MQTGLRTLGVVAALVLLVISAGINARFGFGLGRSEIDGTIYAIASVAVDVLKVATVFFMAWAFASRQMLLAGAALVLFVLCTGYSLASAVGFAAVNRVEIAEARALPKRHLDSLTRRLRDVRKALADLGPARIPGEIEAEMTAQRRHFRWEATEACTEVTLAESRRFCAEYDRLTGALVRSNQAAEKRRQIADLEKQLANASDAGLFGGLDPQGELLAGLLGFKLSSVQMGLSLLMAGLVEFGSAVGLFLATETGLAQKRQASDQTEGQGSDEPEIADVRAMVEAFAIDTVARREGAALKLCDLMNAFEDWCARQDEGVPRPDEASVEIVDLLQSCGVPCIEDGGNPLFLGVCLEHQTT